MPRVSLNFNLPDSSATEALGHALARALPDAVRSDIGQAAAAGAGAVQSGAVVYLQGELGSGKTTCVRSLLRSLGVTGLVRSPTYTLVETYRVATLTCVHVDLYRLQSLTEVDELGLRDQVGPASLLLVEWPERAGDALPPPDLELSLAYSDTGREISVKAHSAAGERCLAKSQDV